MLQKLFKYKYAIVLTFVLILVRSFESAWFYDPFTNYFKDEFQGKEYPEYEIVALFSSWLMRYVINSVLSLSILYVLFREKSIVKFSAILYLLFLLVLFFLLFFLLKFFDEKEAITLFYVRRFLIQPLFLILFIPAFYYQKKNLRYPINNSL